MSGASVEPIVLSDSEDEAKVEHGTVELLDSDDECELTRVTAGSSSSAVIELLDDDDDNALGAALVPKRRRLEAGSGACSLCQTTRASNAFTLAACSHCFCRSCIATHVQKRLRRELASEVTCPTCKTQLSIANVQALSGAAQRGDAAPPPPMPSSSSGFVGGRREGTSVATKRLMKEYQAIQKLGDQGFSVAIPDDSDLYTWDAFFFGFERNTPLAKDLQAAHWSGGKIVLRISFPSQYPSAPPYVRVIRPRFAFRTGHVTIGGSICTEMLTSAGWCVRAHPPTLATTPAYPGDESNPPDAHPGLLPRLALVTLTRSSTMTIESVLVGIRANMLVGGARLELRIRQGTSKPVPDALSLSRVARRGRGGVLRVQRALWI